MSKKNSPFGFFSILIGLGLLGIVGICLGAIASNPNLQSLEPMFDTASIGSTDDYETRYITSISMQPTFQVDDGILVHKKAYESNLPKRGDIILFNPTQKSQEQNFPNAFVLRVIGLPRETIEIRHGRVYINNQRITEDYILEPPKYQFRANKIPKNSYFVLGDNRNNSYDSHYWGYLPQELIVGKVIRIYWPTSRVREFD